ncbi:MAG: preprotein translocase subunit SecY [Gammaproteobacteria bacterium]|nr:preprotein translocase subunit SecY [Gammaproteobacteria bacterium]
MSASPSASSGLSELKQRLLFLLVAIIVYRIGTHIPVPGLDPQRLADFFNAQDSGLLGVFNVFSGGALRRFSLFALGVMPYISASIIVQLMTSVVPQLEQLKKEGESGRRKINQYTRYGTLFLAVFQGLGMTKYIVSNHIALNPDFGFYLVATMTLATGTMFLMWIGEQINERGVGNGISLLIFAGIVSGLPAAVVRVLEQSRQGQMDVLVLLFIAVLILAVFAFVVFVERAQRRITIHYAKRQQGRKMYAAQSSHLPLKLNMTGVIPPIFAMSILLLPGSLGQFLGGVHGFGWLKSVSYWMQPSSPVYMVAYAACIIFFAFFYAALVFNPRDTADNLKRSGAFIPGIRPGEQTANYIDTVMTRLTLVGACYLIFVALLPQILISKLNVPFYFGGTSLLIVVVVLMDFISQIQAHMMSVQYESLLKKANAKGKNRPGAGLLR